MESLIRMINGYPTFLPGVSVDCVIFGYSQQELRVLLLQWQNDNKWSLPGGFVSKDQDVDTATLQVLKDRTSLDFPFLQQFHVAGKSDRISPNDNLNILDELDITDSETRNWFSQRFVSICYLALVDETQLNPVPQVFLKKLEWKPVSMLPNLKWDHNEIISKAVIYLKNQVNYLPVGNALLPEKFTIKELQGLYEAILQKKFDRANFQKKILKLNVLKRHEKLMNGGAHKAPYLYSFDKSMYKKLLEEGVSIVA